MGDALAGLGILLHPTPLLLLVGGVVVGFVVGVLPGFSSSNAAATLLPFALAAPFEETIILMAAIYAGATYGGSVPAILLNLPGEPGSACTALEGYPMTRAGKGDVAVGIARMASALGGLASGLVVLVSINFLSGIALEFGARELFLVAVFGLTIVSAVTGRDLAKGLASALLGLAIAAMSASPLSAQPRFTLGFTLLYEGVPFLPALIGLFALSEMFIVARERALPGAAPAPTPGSGGTFRHMGAGVRETLRHPLVLLRSAAVGLSVGLIPGTGTAVSNFIAYADAKRVSKHPETFGHGSVEGLIASEAADNALTAGSLVPTFTLGIPGSGTAAVMLGALYLNGIQPGPRLMAQYAPEAFAVIWALIAASLLIVPLGLFASGALVRVAYAKPSTIVPAVLVLCTVGLFAYRQSMFDLGMALVFGLLGVVMRQSGYPVVPLVLGLILGPLAEDNLLRALALGRGDLGYFFASPAANFMWLLIVLSVVVGIRQDRRERRRARAVAEEPE